MLVATEKTMRSHWSWSAWRRTWCVLPKKKWHQIEGKKDGAISTKSTILPETDWEHIKANNKLNLKNTTILIYSANPMNIFN
jgi:hypothetical protein